MTQTQEKMTTRQALKSAFSDRQVLAMLILGIASGLPYVLVIGTFGAWLTKAGVKPTAIGLMSWAILAYAFKFLWAATLQRRTAPFGFKTGPNRFFMFVFLALVCAGMFVLSFAEPPNDLGRLGLICVLIAVFSASFDIVLAAWRIQAARDDAHLDILSTVEQFGYRAASFLGGFVALIFANQFGWKATFLSATCLTALTSAGILIARPSPLSETKTVLAQKNFTHELIGHISHGQKTLATVLVLAGWCIGFWLIADFMHGALTDPENHSARAFIKQQGPVVIFSTVVWLGLVSTVLVLVNDRKKLTSKGPAAPASDNGFVTILFQAILEPMIELISRLRWAALLVVMVVLTYRFTDLIWGGFAYPFYLGENYGALGHTLLEVGFSSKLMGVIATILGIGVGGIAMLRFGRMPVFFVGAVLAAVTNLLFADLALNARFTDSFLGLTQLDHLYAVFGLDIRMARLTTVIFAENLAVGIASAASVAYVSSIVNKSYAAVQYALLASLVFLLGSLGRPTIGQIIEEDGFAHAFIICAWLGAVAAILALVEWIRIARSPKT